MQFDVIWCHRMSSDVIWRHLTSSVVICCLLLSSVIICCHLMLLLQDLTIVKLFDEYIHISIYISMTFASPRGVFTPKNPFPLFNFKIKEVNSQHCIGHSVPFKAGICLHCTQNPGSNYSKTKKGDNKCNGYICCSNDLCDAKSGLRSFTDIHTQWIWWIKDVPKYERPRRTRSAWKD